ncbi:hypothetical protein GDO81_001544 [Engystomops pustulosus]|uniref:Uncharacterized protein n=1 Tax=Engystomops pustulosus TaxID=76066 RepID=A0AAV7DFX6_ENGPU|nr:hypothetical protein GDO81_001544 [Engystomops pustulosus]
MRPRSRLSGPPPMTRPCRSDVYTGSRVCGRLPVRGHPGPRTQAARARAHVKHPTGAGTPHRRGPMPLTHRSSSREKGPSTGTAACPPRNHPALVSRDRWLGWPNGGRGGGTFWCSPHSVVRRNPLK